MLCRRDFWLQTRWPQFFSIFLGIRFETHQSENCRLLLEMTHHVIPKTVFYLSGPKLQTQNPTRKKGSDCNESVFVWCVLWASTSNGIINVQVVKSQFVILQVLNYLSILVIYYFIYNSFKNIRIIIVTLNNYYLIGIIFPVKSALISWPLIGGLRFEISWHGADH